MYQVEFLTSEKQAEVDKLKADFSKERNFLEESLKEANDKIAFFRKN